MNKTKNPSWFNSQKRYSDLDDLFASIIYSPKKKASSQSEIYSLISKAKERVRKIIELNIGAEHSSISVKKSNKRKKQINSRIERLNSKSEQSNRWSEQSNRRLEHHNNRIEQSNGWTEQSNGWTERSNSRLEHPNSEKNIIFELKIQYLIKIRVLQPTKVEEYNILIVIFFTN